MTTHRSRTVTREAAPARPRARFWRELFSAPTAIIGFTVFFALVAVALVAPPIFGDAATAQNLANIYAPPSSEHLLGTDRLGRDVLARTLVAVQPSLLVGLTATAIAFCLGVAIGLFATSLPARPRNVALRTIDGALAFPGLLTAIMVMVVLGSNRVAAVVGVGIAIAFSLSRLVSTLALGEAGRDYLQSAQALGLSRSRIVLRYVLPNIAPPLIVGVSVAVGSSVVIVSSLSFLGLGIQPPEYDLGTMLTEGMQAMFQNPAGALAPATLIAAMALSAGLVGEAIARALNPRLWSTRSSLRTATSIRSITAEVERHSHARRTTDADSESASDALLRLDDVSVRIGSESTGADIIKGVSFSVQRGEIVGIVGESGSGKTMTALAIARLLPSGAETSGEIRFRGEDLARLGPSQLDEFLAQHMSFVFQDPMTSLNPALTVGTQLTLGVRRHTPLDRRAALERAANRLSEVHLPAARRQLRRYPFELSGGMRQRVMIAMGLMMEPSLIIADEPTTALDVTVQAQIMRLLKEVNRNHGTSIILISHDLPLVGATCDRILVMYAGRIVEEADADTLMREPLHPYTRTLLGAVPKLGQSRASRLDEIPGQAPEIGREPSGCPFHTRCPIAIERCKVELPAARTHDGGRRVACHVANSDLD